MPVLTDITDAIIITHIIERCIGIFSILKIFFIDLVIECYLINFSILNIFFMFFFYIIILIFAILLWPEKCTMPYVTLDSGGGESA